MTVTSAGQIYNNPPSSRFDYQQHQNYQPQDFTAQTYQMGNPEHQAQIQPGQSDHTIPQQYIYSQSQSSNSQPEIAVQSHASIPPSHNFISQSGMPFHYTDFGQNQYPQHYSDVSFQGLQAQQIHGQGYNNMGGQSRDGGARILAYQFDHDGHNYQYAYETENGKLVQNYKIKTVYIMYFLKDI